jgi:hypothetical protein
MKARVAVSSPSALFGLAFDLCRSGLSKQLRRLLRRTVFLGAQRRTRITDSPLSPASGPPTPNPRRAPSFQSYSTLCDISAAHTIDRAYLMTIHQCVKNSKARHTAPLLPRRLSRYRIQRISHCAATAAYRCAAVIEPRSPICSKLIKAPIKLRPPSPPNQHNSVTIGAASYGGCLHGR